MRCRRVLDIIFFCFWYAVAQGSPDGLLSIKVHFELIGLLLVCLMIADGFRIY